MIDRRQRKKEAGFEKKHCFLVVACWIFFSKVRFSFCGESGSVHNSFYLISIDLKKIFTDAPFCCRQICFFAPIEKEIFLSFFVGNEQVQCAVWFSPLEQNAVFSEHKKLFFFSNKIGSCRQKRIEKTFTFSVGFFFREVGVSVQGGEEIRSAEKSLKSPFL